MPCKTPTSERPRVLLCPACGGDNVHPVRISCVSPGRSHGVVTIDADGLAVDPHREPIGRGVWIAITFGCENGHLFEQQLHFHKGATTVETVIDGRPQRFWHTIWRD